MERKSHKTPKGTTLFLEDIKGKDYLNVQGRLVWFREEHPDWAITTEYLERGADYALAKASVFNEKGSLLQTAHKFEDARGFGDFLEKAETGAIGRALGNLGYGTQFALELEEGERLADAPQNRIAAKSSASTGYSKTEQWKRDADSMQGRAALPRAGADWVKEPCTEAQLKRLYAMAKAAGYNHDGLKGLVKTAFNRDHLEELTKSEIQTVFAELEGKSETQAARPNAYGAPSAAKQPQPRR